ncbi:MAG: molybdenum cofactor biosynthesis protein MoaE [Hydrotalea sp.]|nr:molybdenum cofactor biosynthesis protein MoaE [Hydrotalea sp.]
MKQKIIIQQEKIDMAQAYEFLQAQTGDDNNGALVVFSGVMRGRNEHGAIKKITMEHYDKMTETTIAEIIAAAQEKFLINKTIVLHRVGDILPHDTIVVVGVAATHRYDAFRAAEMVMDYLKSDAPFWKKEIMVDDNNDGDELWVAQKPTDQVARKKWQ